MGGLISTNSGKNSGKAYRWPPKAGRYFADGFVMGGNKFTINADEDHSDRYLFGENTDLNYLADTLSNYPHPYPVPQEPVKTMKAQFYIRKDTLKLVKSIDSDDGTGTRHPKYNINFTYDADVNCFVNIYLQPHEDFSNGKLSFNSRPSQIPLSSQKYSCSSGSAMLFAQSSFIIDPVSAARVEKSGKSETIDYDAPVQVVVHLTTSDDGHCHVLYAQIEKLKESGHKIVPLRQKQVIQGVSFLMQEIYSPSQGYNSGTKTSSDADDSVCTICMEKAVDTMMLPCRHLSFCFECANVVRQSTTSCPICRFRFLAVLNINLLRENNNRPSESDPHVPEGYEKLPLGTVLSGSASSTSIPNLDIFKMDQPRSTTKAEGNFYTDDEQMGGLDRFTTADRNKIKNKIDRHIIKVKKQGQLQKTNSHSSSISNSTDEMDIIRHHTPQFGNSAAETPKMGPAAVSLTTLSESPRTLQRIRQESYQREAEDDNVFPPPPEDLPANEEMVLLCGDLQPLPPPPRELFTEDTEVRQGLYMGITYSGEYGRTDNLSRTFQPIKPQPPPRLPPRPR